MNAIVHTLWELVQLVLLWAAFAFLLAVLVAGVVTAWDVIDLPRVARRIRERDAQLDAELARILEQENDR